MSEKFDQYWQYLKRILVSPAFIVFVICAGLLLFSLASTYKVRPFNSDDVAWQTQTLTWRPFDGTDADQGSTAPFVNKLPFYILMDDLFSPTRRLLFVEAYFFQLIGFACLYLAALYFLRRQKSTISYWNLLPFVWLASFGYSFGQMFLNSNWRGFDLGITFLTFILAAILFQKKYRDKLVFSRKYYAALTGVSLVAGIMAYSDPHYLYFTIAPLFAFALWLRFRKTIGNRQLTTVIAATVASLIAAKLVKILCTVAGVKIMAVYPVQFVDFNAFFGKVSLTIHCMLISFGADFFGNDLISLRSIAGLMNFLLLAIIVVVAWKICKDYLKTTPSGDKDSQAHWYVFFTLLAVLGLALFTFSTMALDLSTYRYFIVILFASILLLTLRMGTATGALRYLTGGLLLLATLGNLLITYHSISTPAVVAGPVTINSNSDVLNNRANEVNFKLIDAIASTGTYKGYANYWQANINTYLSSGRVRALSTLCDTGTTKPFLWLVDKSQFDIKADKSFYLYDPDITSPAICSLDELDAQFGKPSKTITVYDKTLLFYDYDIVKKMPEGVPQH
jgi:hypothetical protein